ncbi:hypothetical protein P692DRAFT_201865617 [Suillus brevipes Sb2]|nr:hypothetical protein P692DRAFT_201865617 [Suillus brevipes Sb2]
MRKLCIKLLEVQIREGGEISSIWQSGVVPKGFLASPSIVLLASVAANSTMSAQMLSGRPLSITPHRYRNISRFFRHMIILNSISWVVLEYVNMLEEDTVDAGAVDFD